MKGSFNLRVIGILYFTFIIFLYTTTNNLVVTYGQESSLDALQNGLSQPMNSHNMTQMMQRGNLAMEFDQTEIGS